MNGSVVNMYDSDAADGAPDAIQQWREGNNNRGGGGADGRKEYTQYLTSLPTDQQDISETSRKKKKRGATSKDEEAGQEDFPSIIINEDPSSSSSSSSSPFHASGPVLIGVSVVVVAVGAVVLAACLISSAHIVDEGCVAVYFRNGALQDKFGEPGIQWVRPFVTRVEQVTVRPETKFLDPLVCTTRDGVRNVFRDVQVIELVREFGVHLKDILVYERVTEAIQLFCSNNTIDEIYNTKFLEVIPFVENTLRDSLDRFAPNGSVQIWNVFLPKPDVPPAIAANYRDVKVEWTKQLVAQQRQKTEKIEKETEKMKAISDAEREKEVDLIEVEKEIQREEGKKNVSSINNAIFSASKRNEADTLSYMQAKEASSNELLHTDAYVRLEVARALSNNTKMYFSGEDGILGGVLGRVFGTTNGGGGD